MKVRCFILTLIGLSILGCSTTPASKKEQPTIANSKLVSSDAETASSLKAQSKSKEPKNLTLPAALALTLENNLELQSFSQAVRTGEARSIQAKLIPNPDISFSIEDVFGSSGGGSYSQATLQLSQVVELGGKRSARVEVATAFQEQLNEEYEIKRIEVLSNVTDKFIRTVADEYLLRLAEKGQHLAKQSLQNIQRRSRAGGVSELEEVKAKVLLARYRIATEHAEHELLASKRTLAAFWGEDKPQFTEISSGLFQTVTLPSFEELSSRIDQSPEIRKWASEKRLREAEKRLAASKAIPNLIVGAGPRRFQEDNNYSWVFQFTMPVPFFDRNQGARMESEILSHKVTIDTDMTRLRLKNTLFGLYQEARHAQTELEIMKAEIIPEAERALKTAQSGHDQGRFSYLDLVDAQRTLIEVHRENIEAAYTFHSLINAMECLLGAPLSTNQRTN